MTWIGTGGRAVGGASRHAAAELITSTPIIPHATAPGRPATALTPGTRCPPCRGIGARPAKTVLDSAATGTPTGAGTNASPPALPLHRCRGER